MAGMIASAHCFFRLYHKIPEKSTLWHSPNLVCIRHLRNILQKMYDKAFVFRQNQQKYPKYSKALDRGFPAW